MGIRSTNILVIIFSRDRAMQLDGVLRSFFLHCRDYERAQIKVLFTTTREHHAQQYRTLISTYTDRVDFIRQNKFRRDVLRLLSPGLRGNWSWLWNQFSLSDYLFGRLFAGMFRMLFEDRYVLFLVDDNIFVRDFSLGDCVDTLSSNNDVLGFSLRLGENTTFCYPMDQPQSLPVFLSFHSDVYKFNWTAAEYDFGYPLEVSSSFYRLKDIAPFLMGLGFKNPNTLEEQMASHTGVFRSSRPFLSCYRRSVAFCNPINRVQSVIPNRVGEVFMYDVDELTARFERGERIKVDFYCGFTPSGCHQEVELIFEQAGVK